MLSESIAKLVQYGITTGHPHKKRPAEDLLCNFFHILASDLL